MRYYDIAITTPMTPNTQDIITAAGAGPNGGIMSALSPADRLAAAIRRRADLHDLARDGHTVPAQVTRETEEEIREAEVELIKAMKPNKTSLNQ
ncbi:MAG TPA: hypothetical protein VNC39_12750 [Acidocella sp.]|jgi:hypothetical protein|uniref:hypothetical protein n=1 Tax=Acidocella sp. TaxID=50710 RepID=UPI002D01A1AC|nr:hypothetical protein [Acidocella sp.]HVE22836.1 hypothetical protein [Acidocella sp.]